MPVAKPREPQLFDFERATPEEVAREKFARKHGTGMAIQLRDTPVMMGDPTGIGAGKAATIMFHGTNVAGLKGLSRKLFRKATGADAEFMPHTVRNPRGPDLLGDAVYGSQDLKGAATYADMAAERGGDKPVVYKIVAKPNKSDMISFTDKLAGQNDNVRSLAKDAKVSLHKSGEHLYDKLARRYGMETASDIMRGSNIPGAYYQPAGKATATEIALYDPSVIESIKPMKRMTGTAVAKRYMRRFDQK